MTDPQRSRRQLLAGLAVPLAGAVAGCQTNFSLGPSAPPTDTEPTYDDLGHERLYVDESLSLTPPDGLSVASEPAAADVIVLPADTARPHSDIVEWLASDRYVALVGLEAQQTWHDVKLGDEYAETFGQPQAMASSCASSGSGSGGSSSSPTDCEPPDVLVVWRLEDIATTYRRTWEATDDPSPRQVFTAIDAALEDD